MLEGTTSPDKYYVAPRTQGSVLRETNICNKRSKKLKWWRSSERNTNQTNFILQTKDDLIILRKELHQAELPASISPTW